MTRRTVQHRVPNLSLSHTLGMPWRQGPRLQEPCAPVLPGGVLQGPGEGGVVVGRVLQGVVPRGGGQHARVRVLATQGVLQRPVEGCFATGPALTFLKLLRERERGEEKHSPVRFCRYCSEPSLEFSLWEAGGVASSPRVLAQAAGCGSPLRSFQLCDPEQRAALRASSRTRMGRWGPRAGGCEDHRPVPWGHRSVPGPQGVRLLRELTQSHPMPLPPGTARVTWGCGRVNAGLTHGLSQVAGWPPVLSQGHGGPASENRLPVLAGPVFRWVETENKQITVQPSRGQAR